LARASSRYASSIGFLGVNATLARRSCCRINGKRRNTNDDSASFFGQGGHLRKDFPLLLSACQKKFPNIALSATPAVGEEFELFCEQSSILASE
jgi:hypothetical protein